VDGERPDGRTLDLEWRVSMCLMWDVIDTLAQSYLSDFFLAKFGIIPI